MLAALFSMKISPKNRTSQLVTTNYQDWNGKVYATTRVRPIFVKKDTEILVITVYTYYF